MKRPQAKLTSLELAFESAQTRDPESQDQPGEQKQQLSHTALSRAA